MGEKEYSVSSQVILNLFNILQGELKTAIDRTI